VLAATAVIATAARIKRRVKNDQDVEDILQNVFYKIHNHISSLNGTDKIHAWVYRITRNSITDFIGLKSMNLILQNYLMIL